MVLREHIAIAREQSRGVTAPMNTEVLPADVMPPERVPEPEPVAPDQGPARGSKRTVSPESGQAGTPSKKR